MQDVQWNLVGTFLVFAFSRLLRSEALVLPSSHRNMCINFLISAFALLIFTSKKSLTVPADSLNGPMHRRIDHVTTRSWIVSLPADSHKGAGTRRKGTEDRPNHLPTAQCHCRSRANAMFVAMVEALPR